MVYSLKREGISIREIQKVQKNCRKRDEGINQNFQNDIWGEFTSSEFNLFYEESSITRHLTAPYSPQQNGVVERHNRTHVEMTRSLMKHMCIPNYIWGEAVRHATYLINRVAT